MKRIIISISVIFSLCFVASCAFEDDDFYHQDDFDRSYECWLDFKNDSRNTYYYVTTFDSWNGSHIETEIIVEHGVVVERNFWHNFYENGQLIDGESYSWSEVGYQVGTHREGSAPLTLDEVYDIAERDWLADRPNVKYYLRTENAGMISLCGYMDNNCADDCFVGIEISEIGFLE